MNILRRKIGDTQISNVLNTRQYFKSKFVCMIYSMRGDNVQLQVKNNFITDSAVALLAKSLDIQKSTIHEPSFKRDSPSIRELNLLGAPTSLRRARTAIVSVHERIEPNIKAPLYVQQESSYYRINLMLMRRNIEEKSTQGKARNKICPPYFLKVCQSLLNPPSKIRMGKKIIRRPRGFILAIWLTVSPSKLMFYENFPINIPITNSIGV